MNFQDDVEELTRNLPYTKIKYYKNICNLFFNSTKDRDTAYYLLISKNKKFKIRKFSVLDYYVVEIKYTQIKELELNEFMLFIFLILIMLLNMNKID